jgi:hypothetical protein
MRPQVIVTKQINSLGGVPPTEDGIAILVVNPPAGYTTTGVLVFKTLKDAENAGITEAKDLANNYLLWEHLKDFFLQADGTEIHVLKVAEVTTITNLFTVANANYVLLQNYLASQQGRIKLLGVALKPSATETNTGLSTDLITAIPLAQTFADLEYTRLRPIDIILEGRALTGSASATQNLRALAAGNVSVMVARDATRKAALTTAGNTGAASYAAVGLLLGTLAKIHVGRNIGRVKNEALPIDTAEFSGGQKPYATFNETDLDTLNTKGYIYFDRYPNKAGWFFNDDHTCALVTLSNAFINLNRVLNKASRIAIGTYIEELKDEVLIDSTTGQLAPIVVQGLQNRLQSAIENEMMTNPDPTREREISSAKVTIDPAQNILATSKIVAQLQIVPLGISRIIETLVELVNPNS